MSLNLSQEKTDFKEKHKKSTVCISLILKTEFNKGCRLHPPLTTKTRLNPNLLLQVPNLRFSRLGSNIQVPNLFDSPGFDIRIAPTENLKEFEAMIKEWLRAAGEDVTYEFVQVSQQFPTSKKGV